MTKTIDFRYASTIQVYGPGTEEYDKLLELEEEDWEKYLTEMAAYGVTIEYILEEDIFTVRPSIA